MNTKIRVPKEEKREKMGGKAVSRKQKYMS